VLNTSLRPYRVWVCLPEEAEENWLEVTQYCSGESGGFLTLASEPLDYKGLVRMSGSLNLVVAPYDPIYDPWENAERWAIGNIVRVKIADEAGTLRNPPINHLYIVGDPVPPYPGNWVLSIDLGCLFTLHDSTYPATALGRRGTRLTAIQSILSEVDADIVGELPNGTFEGFQPDSQAAFPEQIGEVAIGALSALWQNKRGEIATLRLNTKPDRRLFKHVVGVDDAGEFELLQNAKRPPSEAKAVGKAGFERDENRDKQKYRGSLTINEFLSESSIAEDGGTTEILAIVRSENWAWNGSPGTRYQTTIEESRCRGLIVPESLYDSLEQQGRQIFRPGPYGRYPALFQEENKEYEGNSEGRLLSSVTRIYKCEGEVLADFWQKNLLPNASIPSFLDLFEAERIETTYEYSSKDGDDSAEGDKGGQVRKIKTIRRLPKGQVCASANDWIGSGIAGPFLRDQPTDLIVAEVKIESWRKRAKDEWEYRNTELKAGQVRSGTIKAFRSLRKVKGEVKISRNGDIRPPAAERRPSEENTPLQSDRRVEGSVSFNNISKRDRLISVDYFSTQQDAEKLAEIMGEIEHFRHQGFRITTIYRDEWLYWKPLCRVDLEYNNYVYHGLVDLFQIQLSADQAIVVADCMRTGRYPASP
jgi:hypothetical protein